MCENLSSGRSAAAGKEGVEIRLQDRGTEGFEHSCDKTGEVLSPLLLSLPYKYWGVKVTVAKWRQLGGREG